MAKEKGVTGNQSCGGVGMPTLPVVPLTAVDKQLFEMAKGKESTSTPLLHFERRVDVDV